MRVLPAPSSANGVRKSARIGAGYDGAGMLAEHQEAEPCEAEAADASAWLLDGVELY